MAILHQMLHICDILQHFAEEEPPMYFEPHAFFLARSGVLTLAYSGFPTGILRIQDALDDVDQLPVRTPGSIWPKTTIGALHDGTVLNRREIEEVLRLSESWKPKLAECNPVPIRTIATVEYESRSLEKVDYVMATEFSGNRQSTGSVISDEHRRVVANILSQFSAEWLDLYQEEIQSPGHHASHYNTAARGRTVIIDVEQKDVAFIADFIADVDRTLPGYYSWFDPRCYHVTVRNLSRV